MGLLNGRVSFHGRFGWVCPKASNSKRKRFAAKLKIQGAIVYKEFPTRRAAALWLAEKEATTLKEMLNYEN